MLAIIDRSAELDEGVKIAMANLLANERLAPGLLQAECSGDRPAAAPLAILHDPKRVPQMQRRYGEIQKALRMDSHREAATAVLALLPCQ